MSPRQDIDRADHIGVLLEVALYTSEFRLCLAVVRMDMPASRARPAGVVRRYGDEPASRPEGQGLTRTRSNHNAFISYPLYDHPEHD